MTSKKRITKYKQTGNAASVSSTNDPIAFRRTRRHSWFGEIVNDSVETSYRTANGLSNVKKSNSSIDALDLKPPGTPSLIEQAAHVFGFSSDSQQRNENSSKNSKGRHRTPSKIKQRSIDDSRIELNQVSSSLNDSSSVAERNSPFNPLMLGTSCPNLTRLMQRRATIQFASNGSPALMDHLRRTAYSSLRPNEIRAMEQLKDVCRDYIVYKLSQHNLMNRVTINREPTNERWIFLEILFIAQQLERIQKDGYNSISSQIGVTIRSEEMLKKIFFELSTEIITTEPEQSTEFKRSKTLHAGLKSFHKHNHRPPLSSMTSRYTEVTWGRICAVLLVAAGLALDCVQNGHSSFVNHIIEHVGDFAREEDILNWIVEQGGWEALRQLTRETNSCITEIPDSAGYNRITNTAVAFVLCIAGAIFALFSVGNLTD